MRHEVAPHAERQEDRGRVHRHRGVDRVLRHSVDPVALRERLGVEARHRDRADAKPACRRLVEKLLADRSVGELVVEGGPVAEAAHVHLDAVGADLRGQFEGAELLPLEDHPVADTDGIPQGIGTVGRDDRRGGPDGRGGDGGGCEEAASGAGWHRHLREVPGFLREIRRFRTPRGSKVALPQAAEWPPRRCLGTGNFR